MVESSLSAQTKRTGDVLKKGASDQIVEYNRRFGSIKDLYGSFLVDLLVSDNSYEKAYEVAIGDIIRSCIVDASLSISIGQALFPQPISGQLATTTIIYTFIASILVISTLLLRGKIDKKAGIIFLSIYLSSYLLIAI